MANSTALTKAEIAPAVLSPVLLQRHRQKKSAKIVKPAAETRNAAVLYFRLTGCSIEITLFR